VLYGCQLRKFGTLDPATGAFTELFSFNKVETFAQCPGEPMSAKCEAQLCRDYCAIGHFPETPMCTVYQTKTCGPCAAIPAAEGCTIDPSTLPGAGQGGAGGGAGTSSSAGAGGAGGSGGSAGTTQSSAGRGGSSARDGGAGDDDDDDKGGGGCSVGSLGSNTAQGSSLLLILLAGALRLRRRARVHT
jgi:hypothetical protein